MSEPYKPKNAVRIVTAASLFDGHDASINMIRRLLQDTGAEVIHLGHNRSVMDVVIAALQEGAQGICVSSYQGGHMEYFKYMRDLLDSCGAGYVKIFGGGGGVIIYEEKQELEKYGIDFVFHPEDGRRLGLQGMINLIVERSDFDLKSVQNLDYKNTKSPEGREDLMHRLIGLAIDQKERFGKVDEELLKAISVRNAGPIVLGITGTGGAGKSSLIDELLQRFLNAFPNKKIAVVCVDPTKRKTGGALLGDRIRMNSLQRKNAFMRSMASRGSGSEIAKALPDVLNLLKTTDFDFIIAETSGIGQANAAITEVSDVTMYVMTSEFGAQSQLEKIDMIDYANVIAINKADRRGAEDALRDVRKQYRRSRKQFDLSDDKTPAFLTQAAQFNDKGCNQLFFHICDLLNARDGSWTLPEAYRSALRGVDRQTVIPAERQNYLAEIASTVRRYKKETEDLAEKARVLGAIDTLEKKLNDKNHSAAKANLEKEIPQEALLSLKEWEAFTNKYKQAEFEYEVRGKIVRQPLTTKSLSGLDIRRVVPPRLADWGDRLRFLRLENMPGFFPFTAGVFPLKRSAEDPKRMFAGEGPPERTNKRFHFLSKEEPAKRLSTAFDSVTLYGFDPHKRPDIFGKVGESGVSICSLDDMKRLYDGFDLCSPNTSVSMTINGPAPMILAYFLNTAIDQQVEKKEKELSRKLTPLEHAEVQKFALHQVRGTVQADILKEDQGQNTCIFSIDFALKMMGDIQQYFIDQNIRNFYSVSISGYHIAEAGANPISQVAFTLSNAFTFVEYYLARG
ncbi:MAG: cobalamin-dependent protein, partial [Bdellovibrionaceae bacterium]|nr:cobalamin-dependent protein [Pseudobdellovibrionaceae bacterium]